MNSPQFPKPHPKLTHTYTHTSNSLSSWFQVKGWQQFLIPSINDSKPKNWLSLRYLHFNLNFCLWDKKTFSSYTGVKVKDSVQGKKVKLRGGTRQIFGRRSSRSFCFAKELYQSPLRISFEGKRVQLYQKNERKLCIEVINMRKVHTLILTILQALFNCFHLKRKEGRPSRWRSSEMWRLPSSPQIHQNYICAWNNSYRTPTERWQKTSDFPKGEKLLTHLGRAKEKTETKE